MTSAANAAVAANAAAATGAAPPVHDEKLTGQRNENSVLFSLSALTDKEPKGASSSSSSSGNGNRTTATADGSGLIDIRALSANMDEEGSKKKDKGARVDDIMNLSGGGAFGAALAAPILAPPPLEVVDLGVTASAPPKQNKTLVFAILGGCAFIAIGIVVAVVMTRPPASTGRRRPPGRRARSARAPTRRAASPPPRPTDTHGARRWLRAPTTRPPPPGTGNNAPSRPT